MDRKVGVRIGRCETSLRDHVLHPFSFPYQVPYMTIAPSTEKNTNHVGFGLTEAQMDLQGLRPLNTKNVVADWVGCTPRHIDNLVRAGVFPAPIRLGNHPRWCRSELFKWLDEQKAK